MFDPAWEAAHAEREWGIWPSEHFVRFVKRNFTVPAQFVDLGCGIGAQTRFLALEGFSVHAIDGSGCAIDTLTKWAWNKPRRGVVSFQQADLETLSVDGWRPIDCAVDVCTLQHLPFEEARALVQRIRGALSPQGWFFSITDAGCSPDTHGPFKQYARSANEVVLMFEGFTLAMGHESIVLPGGNEQHGRISRWIIEARKCSATPA